MIIASSGSNQAEKDNPENLSLAGDGFDTVIKAKAAVDAIPSCKNKVSCADILAMAARDVVALVRSYTCSVFFFFFVYDRHKIRSGNLINHAQNALLISNGPVSTYLYMILSYMRACRLVDLRMLWNWEDWMG